MQSRDAGEGVFDFVEKKLLHVHMLVCLFVVCLFVVYMHLCACVCCCVCRLCIW